MKLYLYELLLFVYDFSFLTRTSVIQVRAAFPEK